jgi:hypothetical protein
MDHSSHGVFVSKNQKEVNYPFDHRARAPLHPRSISALPSIANPHPLVPSLAADTFVLARSRGGTGN